MNAKLIEVIKRKALGMGARERARYAGALRVSEGVRELLRRAFARERLIDFCCYIDPEMAEMYLSPHLCLIADYLERAEIGRTLWDDVEGVGKRILIISSPPRHWKSSLVSMKFPAWVIGRRRRAGLWPEMITTSYGASLATRNSRYVLETVRDNPLYGNLFPEVAVDLKAQASDDWKLKGSVPSTMKASGMDGSLTGYGGIVMLDDPLKNRKDANSDTVRKNQWEFWTDTMRTRINPSDYCVIVLTRWHEDDIVGRLLREEAEEPGNERIVYLRLPALAETEAERRAAAKAGLPYDEADPLGRDAGEALAPHLVSAAEHGVTARKYPMTHAALNQGNPLPVGGYLVDGEKFVMLDSVPMKHVRWVVACDWAITEKEKAPKSRPDPDYTAVGLVGMWTPNGNKKDVRLVVGFMNRGQLDDAKAKTLVKEGLKRSCGLVGRRVLSLRSGQANADRLFMSALRRDAELVGQSVANLPRKKLQGDKVTKAQPWLEMLAAGQVFMVRGGWNEDLKKEVTQFPKGAHDDMCDVLSVAVAAFGLGYGSKKAASSRANFYG